MFLIYNKEQDLFLSYGQEGYPFWSSNIYSGKIFDSVEDAQRSWESSKRYIPCLDKTSIVKIEFTYMGDYLS